MDDPFRVQTSLVDGDDERGDLEREECFNKRFWIAIDGYHLMGIFLNVICASSGT